MITLRRRLVRRPCAASAIVATILWWLSLRPSLLPRSWLYQGLVGGVCIAIGIGLGAAANQLLGFILRRARRPLPPSVPMWTWRILPIVITLAVAVGSWRWHDWQQEQRPLVLLDGQSPWSFLPMLIVTVIVAALLLTIARTIVHLIGKLDGWLSGRMPATTARRVTILAVGGLTVAGLSFAGARFAGWADQNFGTFDTTTADGIEPPTLAVRSGGPGSLVSWDDLGFQGRNFIGDVPSSADIAAFTGEDALDPVRVYVGLQSADTTEERVDLAVSELERTGAFDREVLLVVTPTGTGWVNPDAARTLEYMHGGDTAIVSVQYSFLPSWIAFLLDTRSPGELGQALFDGVYAAWSALPENDRPQLVVYGESLGSLGGERPFARDDVAASIDAITDQVDGALFVGPTRGNPIFGELIDDRDAGTPAWRPGLAERPALRVANSVDEIAVELDGWPTPRVLYLHHASDAIGTWQWSNIWSDPGWGDDPPPADVPAAVRWVPIVSFVQESIDLMNGFSATPGHGHDYRTEFVDAWSVIVPPDGWTAQDTAELRSELDL